MQVQINAKPAGGQANSKAVNAPLTHGAHSRGESSPGAYSTRDLASSSPLHSAHDEARVTRN
jgi:hypothetical protein